MTPYGVHAYLPFIDIGDECILVDIFCFDTKRSSAPVYLVLRPNTADRDRGKRRRYYCQCISHLQTGVKMHSRIACPVGYSLSCQHWKDIYITPRPPHRSNHTLPDVQELLSRLTLGPAPPFRFESMMSLLAHKCDLHLTSVTPQIPIPWTGHPPVELRFAPHYPSIPDILVRLGRCKSGRSHVQEGGLFYVVIESLDGSSTSVGAPNDHEASHSCPKDHVTSNQTRMFLIQGHAPIQVVFRRSPISDHLAEETLEVHDIICYWSAWTGGRGI